jgi:hypothetical protein
MPADPEWLAVGSAFKVIGGLQGSASGGPANFSTRRESSNAPRELQRVSVDQLVGAPRDRRGVNAAFTMLD